MGLVWPTRLPEQADSADGEMTHCDNWQLPTRPLTPRARFTDLLSAVNLQGFDVGTVRSAKIPVSIKR